MIRRILFFLLTSGRTMSTENYLATNMYRKSHSGIVALVRALYCACYTWFASVKQAFLPGRGNHSSRYRTLLPQFGGGALLPAPAGWFLSAFAIITSY